MVTAMASTAVVPASAVVVSAVPIDEQESQQQPVSRLLDLIVPNLYSHKEGFLLELVRFTLNMDLYRRMLLHFEALEEAIKVRKLNPFSTNLETHFRRWLLWHYSTGKMFTCTRQKRVYLNENCSGKFLLAQIKIAYQGKRVIDARS